MSIEIALVLIGVFGIVGYLIGYINGYIDNNIHRQLNEEREKSQH